MIGSGAGARYAYIAEVTPGTTPTTPTFKVMRTTGGGLRNNKSTSVSDQVRADRNVPDEILVGVDAGGSYPFELTYGSFDDIMAAALFGSWSTDVLKNGISRQFFTFEETIELGATDSFSRFTMSMIDMLSLDIQARQKITGSFNVFAQKETLGTAILSGATYTAANTKQVMSAGASVGALAVASLNPVPKLRRIQLQVGNNLRRRPVIGSLYSEEYGEGRCDVTGTLEAYFESNDLYQAVLDHGGGALSVTLGQDDDEHYTIDLPNIVFLDGARQLGGNNDDVIVSVPFRAKYSASDAASIKITRAVA